MGGEDGGGVTPRRDPYGAVVTKEDETRRQLEKREGCPTSRGHLYFVRYSALPKSAIRRVILDDSIDEFRELQLRISPRNEPEKYTIRYE